MKIDVIGAGIAGLWQAVTLAGRGHDVWLFERNSAEGGLSSAAASWFAGGMLAPFCEEEAAEPIVRLLGLRGIELWRKGYAGVVGKGSLVVALRRDRAELDRFERMTRAHQRLDEAEIAALEPALGGRFARGLFFAAEAHLPPRAALDFLRGEAVRLGVRIHSGQQQDRAPTPTLVTAPTPVSGNGQMAFRPGAHSGPNQAPSRSAPAAASRELPLPAREAKRLPDWTVDCSGMGAAHALSDADWRSRAGGLRGVRGEMAVIRTDEIVLARPVRLLHPRFPLYVVPWGDGRFMVGATVIERSDDGPVTVRGALDLLGTAYALHPAFGEAEIVELSAGVRPAFNDNIPKVVVSEGRLYVNGMYRHGYLTAPVFAEIVAGILDAQGDLKLALAGGPWESVVEDCRERGTGGNAGPHPG